MMKKNIFLIIAATAISCAACQKESSSDRNTDYLTTLNFTSGNLSTKTIADAINKTILWEKGDKIGVAYTVDGTWQNASGNATNDKPAKIYTSNGLDAGGETAVFNISGSFNATNTGAHQFYSVYPSSCVKSTDIKYAPSITMTIPSIQTPTANSFDSAADLMIGKATKTYNSIEEAKADEITLLWQRLVSHADIILKGFQGLTENETINSIILTADADAKLVGERWIDIQNGNISEPTSITNANVLTINGTNININNNDVEFWVAVMPATVKSLNVVVETTKATYTRSIETCNIEFKQNARKGLIIDMSGVDRVEREEDPDYSGEWLIVDNDMKHSCLNYSTGKFYGKYDMLINDGVIHETQELSDCKMILKRNNDNGNKQGLYTIQDSKGLYIKCNGEKNISGVTSLDDACYWKITYDEEKTLWKITSTTTTPPYYLLYNTSSPRFTTYAKTAATVIDIKLFSYKDVRPLTDPILSADKAITSPAEGIENGTMSITVKNIETVNTSVDGTVVTSASVSGSILTYTISENTTTDVRKGSITLSADGVDDVTIEVTQKAAGAVAIKTYTLSFPDTSDDKVQNYTSTWEAKRDDFTWTLTNWNNNNAYNNNWTYIKAGSKSTASTATITTSTTMPEAISSVTMTITDVTAANINAIKLEVLSGDTIKETITGTAAAGDCVFKIENPQKDCKYKITVDCKKGSKNGLISVSKVVYTE